MSWSRRIVQWSLRTFGQPTEASLRERFECELREWAVEKDPFKKAEEVADMIIVLAGYVHRTTGKELADFVEMKMQINEHRSWKWFGDGTGKRIKSAAHEEWERRTRRDWFFSLEGEREALAEYRGLWEIPPDADTIEPVPRCPERESGGMQCELVKLHSGPHACPEALRMFQDAQARARDHFAGSRGPK